jgi:hypothetical protein
MSILLRIGSLHFYIIHLEQDKNETDFISFEQFVHSKLVNDVIN